MIEDVASRGVKNTRVYRSGCMGRCDLEPTVEVYVPGQPLYEFTSDEMLLDDVGDVVDFYIAVECSLGIDRELRCATAALSIPKISTSISPSTVIKLLSSALPSTRLLSPSCFLSSSLILRLLLEVHPVPPHTNT